MKCPLCKEDKKLLQHHVSYSDRQLFRIEVIVRVCNDCHYKIHEQDGFHDELDPFGGGIKYEDFILRMFETCEHVELGNDNRKYKIYKEDDEWEMEEITPPSPNYYTRDLPSPPNPPDYPN